jgi:hypothetical protein
VILPTRHISTNASLIGVGALVLARLGSRPRFVNELWTELRDESGVVTFDRFCLAVTFLYVLGAVEHEGGNISRVGL